MDVGTDSYTLQFYQLGHNVGISQLHAEL
ncbi:hypothetical protein C5167_028456 [Papaver somniferum]|nr:hypothetical protein C5167_028456 [Papaver somniferum]